MAIDFNKYINSTGTHYISNSGKDERNAYHGGKAGDQTGHEWELKSWYNRPWTVVLRWPDINVGLQMAKLGIAAALNNKIGYDQYQRTTYWKQLEKVGYDPSKITEPCEEDCTAGVCANCKAAGCLMDIKGLKDLPISVYSGNMKSVFVKAGFRALTAKKYLTGTAYLLPGDVLLYEGHHAAMNITYGKSSKKEVITAPPKDIKTAKRVLITGGLVNVRSAPSLDGRILGVVKEGTQLSYQGETRKDGSRNWLLVIYNNENAWVSDRYAEVL